jgi:hypothetical protein
MAPVLGFTYTTEGTNKIIWVGVPLPTLYPLFAGEGTSQIQTHLEGISSML